MTRPLVFPVIHVQHAARTLDNAAMAFEAGCDGVFLISMDGHCEVLEDQARAVKSRWPDKRVGVNYLSRTAVDAIHIVAEAGLDMTWSDDAHVHTEQGLEHADAIAAALARYPGHQFFGGVAFKYKKHEPNPGLAATRAHARGIIATTSGAGTGKAAEVGKIELMSQALQGGPLAIASGITPDNVLEYAPYLSHILVATGVSKNEHDFDFELLCQLMGKLNTFFSAGATPTGKKSFNELVLGMAGAGMSFIVSGDTPGTSHTMILGTSGRGRSILMEQEAVRLGINVDDLYRDREPTGQQKAVASKNAEDRKLRTEARIQAVRDAYWSGSDGSAGEFDTISDALVNFLALSAPTTEQKKAVFDLLPAGIIGKGISWGFDDTEARDGVYGFVRDNVEAVRAALEGV